MLDGGEYPAPAVVHREHPNAVRAPHEPWGAWVMISPTWGFPHFSDGARSTRIQPRATRETRPIPKPPSRAVSIACSQEQIIHLMATSNLVGAIRSGGNAASGSWRRRAKPPQAAGVGKPAKVEATSGMSKPGASFDQPDPMGPSEAPRLPLEPEFNRRQNGLNFGCRARESLRQPNCRPSTASQRTRPQFPGNGQPCYAFVFHSPMTRLCRKVVGHGSSDSEGKSMAACTVNI